MIIKALRTPESAPKAAQADSEIGKSLAGNGSSQKAAAGAAAANVAGSSSGASATGAGNHAGAINENN